MDITPLVPKNRQVITGYGGGGFRLNNQPFSGSLLLLPDHTQAWDGVIASLNPVDFTGVEFLLIGSGASILPLDESLRGAFRAKNIRIDVMDTGAACRTYNVLLSEERRVAAALIAV